MIEIALLALAVCWVLSKAFSPGLSERDVAQIRRDLAQDYARDDARRGRDAEGWWKQHGTEDR